MIQATVRCSLALIAFVLVGACSKNLDRNLARDGVVFCSEGNPSTFNPQLDASGTTADATSHQLYDRLLEFDPETSQIIPGLASSWRVSKDGLSYVFQLRRQVSFHTTNYFTPGRYFNADDVIFSINRWRLNDHPFHSVSNATYPYFMGLGLNTLIAEVKRINGYRVEIVLSRPDSSFLANLATDFAVILSAEYAKSLTAANTPDLIDSQPIGTGPYRFASYRKDNYIRYQKHADYWKHDSAPERLIFDITPSSSLRLAKLMTGECDAMAYPAHSEHAIVRQREDLVLDSKSGLNIGFWAFNTSKPPFDQVNVRRALAMAVDKRNLLEAVYFDSATSAHSIIPPSSWAYEEKGSGTSYNPILARQLLKDSGIPDGFTLDIWAMPVQRAYNPNATKMAEILQEYLADVGVIANIVTYEWSTFRQRLNDGEHDTVLIGWAADNGDPDNFYRPLLTCSAIDSGTNRARWCNSQYDDLINEALKFTDIELRKAYYHLANAILADQLPLVPIAHANRYQARRANLEGLGINPFGGIRFGDVGKQP